MNNLKNSASPTASTASQEVKRENSSYWLAPEEIKELHEDAQRSLAIGRELDKRREAANQKK